jgi:5-keto-L-gluconate epimerase
MKLSIVQSVQATQFQAATLQGDLGTNLDRIGAWGYEGVELAIRDPSLINMETLEQMTRERGLEVPAIGTGQAWGEEGLSFTDKDEKIRCLAVDRIKSHIPGAARVDALIIIGLIRGLVKPGVSHNQAMDWLVRALRECCEAVHESGLRLALEPINHLETSLINTVAEGLELVRAVDYDNFGLLLDTYHMHMEEANLEDSIRSCGSHIFHFHVADSNRWHPGAGELDFRSIIKSLKDSGYSGWISGEFLPMPDPLTAAEKNIQELKKYI